MKKLIIKMAMMLFIGLGILNYLFYLKTGKNPLANIDFSLPSMDSMSVDKIKSALPDVKIPSLGDKEGSPTTVYKWTDGQGVTHYTQEEPTTQPAKALTVDPNTNIIQADIPTQPEPKAAQVKAESDYAPAPKPVLTLPTPSNTKQLIEDAKNVQTLMNERAANIEAAAGERAR